MAVWKILQQPFLFVILPPEKWLWSFFFVSIRKRIKHSVFIIVKYYISIMATVISKSTLSGNITVPPSKSLFQRACAAALLKQGATVIQNCGISDDDHAAIDIVKQFGAQVVFVGTSAIMKFEQSSQQITETIKLNAKESGLSSRMFMPIAATLYYSSIIDGEGSLKNRPFLTLINALRALELQVFSDNDLLPIRIEGNLLPQNITIDGSQSSQFLTGLLLAYSSFSLATPVTITVENLVSKPYIDLTLKIIEDFQLNKPQHNNYQTFVFEPKDITPGQKIKYVVEGDWSAGITLLVATALTGETTIEGLNAQSVQGDKQVLHALMDAGIKLEMDADKITVVPQTLKAFTYNATDTPDAFPVLAALASQCEGVSVIEGVHRLKHKESNRAEAIVEVLTKLGVAVKIADDRMEIEGTKNIQGGITLNAFGDHRMAMMITILGMIATEPIIMEDGHVVRKSYPSFYEDLKNIGANIQID